MSGDDGDGGAACARDLLRSCDPDRTVNGAASYAARVLHHHHHHLHLARKPNRRYRCRYRVGGAQNETAWNGCDRATGSAIAIARRRKKRTRKRREVEAVWQLSMKTDIYAVLSALGVPRHRGKINKIISQLTCFAFQLAAVLDRDQLEGPVLCIDWHLADGDNRLEPFNDAAEHDVLALQVGTRPQGYKELARVCAVNVDAARNERGRPE